MSEIIFTNIQVMLDEIRKHTKENCTYVIPADDFTKGYVGWYCLNTNTYFYITLFRLSKSNNEMNRYLDSFTKRKIASVYLSNCSTEAQYNIFKSKVDKLKAFW